MTGKRRKLIGVTVMELLISSGLFLLLTTALLSLFLNSIEAWTQVEDRTGLISQTERMFSRVIRELESSNSATVEFTSAPFIFSFASPFPLESATGGDSFEVLPATGALQWNKYLVFYHDPEERTLEVNELEIPTGSPARSTPLPISAVDFGGGPEPLSEYGQGGRIWVRDVESASVAQTGRTYQFEILLKTGERSAEFIRSVLTHN